MITLRRARDRHYVLRRKRESWQTFHTADPTDPLAAGFGALESFDEDRLPPNASVPHHSAQDAEVVTYVREGALAYEDSAGHSGVIHAGEFQSMIARRGIRHSESNVSRTDWAHVFQIWLHPWKAGLDACRDQKRFSAAERRGGLCIIASPDARRGSLRIHQDAVVYSAMLEPGQHVVNELAVGRTAWLHLLQGEVVLDELILTGGDGVGVTAERAVSFTAREHTEILLLDLGAR